MPVQILVGMNNKVFHFGLEDISCFKKFVLNGRWIESLDGIYSISITDDLFIIVTEDHCFRDGRHSCICKDKYSTDTIKAYNWNGEIVWCIRDIIKDLTGEYLSGYLIDREKAATLPDGYPPLYNGRKIEDILAGIDKSHYLYACFDAGWRYVLDITDRRVLFRTPTK